MKRCPECRRDYYDDSLLYCLDDGSALLEGPASVEEPGTAVFSSTRLAEKKTAIFSDSTQQASGRSIAVLPFAHLSSDPDDEYFCDGLAEELLNALARIDGLKVAARTSAFSFKGKNTSISEIGTALKVGNVLEGSVRKSGSRLRITVQLVNASDGYHLWSERYDRQMSDIFEVQDEITLAVVDALKVRLLNDVSPIEPPTSDTAAYELYLKGRSLLYQRGLSIRKAIECFQKAVDLDPKYAQAWAGLADGYTTLGYSGYQPAAEVMPQALDAARQSLELDPDLAEGHNALACATMLYDLGYDLAESEFLRALELYPDYPQARAWYGLFLLQWVSARNEEARDELQRALQIDPLSGYAHVIMSFSCLSSGRFAEAVEHSKRGVELDPSSYLAHWCYSAALEYEKQYEKAVIVAEQALAMSGRHSWAMMTLASTYAAWGKPDDAKAVFRELEARSRREYIPPAMLAATAAVVGEIDRAVEFAQQALDRRDPLLVMLARTWPDYDNLRSDPRFLEIVGKLGLPGWPSAHDRYVDETHRART